jgi:hypothetical protein
MTQVLCAQGFCEALLLPFPCTLVNFGVACYYSIGVTIPTLRVVKFLLLFDPKVRAPMNDIR